MSETVASGASEGAARLTWSRAWPVVAATVLVMVLTASVYLVRATEPLGANWPVTFNLTSSDNGVLYQLSEDIFSGRLLDWSFSPQTYTFPEIPISVIAYAVTFGNLYWYYIVVAAMNVALLFLALFSVIRHLFPEAHQRDHVLRAFIATAPLWLLPLFTHNSIYLYHLAATYYYGVYLLGFLLPIALLSTRRWVRIVVLAGWALAGASNPLLLAMTLPGVALIWLITFLRNGWRGEAMRFAVTVGVTVAVSALLRITVLSTMVAADPTSYINASKAFDRERAIYSTFKEGFKVDFDPILLAISALAMVVCAVSALLALRAYFAATHPDQARQHRISTRVYLTTLPFLGMVAMYLIMAVHLYYLWFFAVGVIVVAAIIVPRPRAVPWTAGVLALLTVVGSVFMLMRNPGDGLNYFGYRAPLTQCIDDNVEAGARGYSTFSDARNFGLTSDTGMRFIPINPSIEPNFWLTNRAYSKHETGTFVLINPNTAEPPIEGAIIAENFGAPERVVSCGEGVELWFYESAAAQQRIEQVFIQWADLR